MQQQNVLHSISREADSMNHDESRDELFNSDSNDVSHRDPQPTKRPLSQHIVNDRYSRKVPIYRIQSSHDKLLIPFSQKSHCKIFARGELIGRFQQSPYLHYLNAQFVGIFDGIFDWQKVEEDTVFFFFEGSIPKIQFFTKIDLHLDDKGSNKISLDESSFKGYFKGSFCINKEINIKEDFQEDLDVSQAPFTIQNIKKSIQYYLPTLFCFSIKNIGDINLEKNSAVVNGNLYVHIKYNSKIDKMLQDQKKKKKQKHFVSLNFNRDITLFLPLQQDDDDEQDGSQSQWSIQDKTWDIELTKDKVNKTLNYKIAKRFGAEIDNSFGSFFAPFNLNRLKIVISISSTKLKYKNKDFKLHFTCVDTYDYGKSGDYNPFENFNQLAEDRPTCQQVNRYHKINRHFCTDNGEYIIADNRLALFPHFKNILRNRAYSNAEAKWNLGLGTWQQFLKPTLAQDAQNAFEDLKQLHQRQQKKFKYSQIPAFSFLRWDNVIIEIPIYKYIVIDMLKIFLPLTIITVLSLFIFNQENGVGTQSQFTTLAYRLVNVASIAIAYSAMIPIILQSLPKMPGITLIEIITYLETIPSLLSIFNSMIWKQTFSAFHDDLFLIGFALTLFNFCILISVFVGYICLEFNANPFKIQWRSPNYLKFIESVKNNKKGFYKIKEENT